MERFNKYDVPMTAIQFDDHNWFAHGVMWDLLDNQVDNTTFSLRRSGSGVFINGIVDNCFVGNLSNTNNLSSIFDRLNSNIETPTQFRDVLINAYPAQAAEISNLFNSYGY